MDIPTQLRITPITGWTQGNVYKPTKKVEVKQKKETENIKIYIPSKKPKKFELTLNGVFYLLTFDQILEFLNIERSVLCCLIRDGKNKEETIFIKRQPDQKIKSVKIEKNGEVFNFDSTKEAAHFLEVTPSTLSKWKRIGKFIDGVIKL